MIQKHLSKWIGIGNSNYDQPQQVLGECKPAMMIASINVKG